MSVFGERHIFAVRYFKEEIQIKIAVVLSKRKKIKFFSERLGSLKKGFTFAVRFADNSEGGNLKEEFFELLKKKVREKYIPRAINFELFVNQNNLKLFLQWRV